MTKNKRLLFIVLLFTLSALACGLLQQPLVTSIPPVTAIIVDTSTAIPTLEPTALPMPTLTPTPLPVPTLKATQTPEISGPFQFVASLADVLDDASDQVQLRALDDGSVWIITSHKVLRWNGKSWKEMISSAGEMLAAVDDGGRLWVLYPDAKEISALQGEDWILYGASRGWKNVGKFDYSGWAPSPWGIYRDMRGTLWLPMERDVRSFDGDRWSRYTLEDMGFPQPDMDDISIVHNLAMAKNGAEVWVGECYYSGPGPMGGGGVHWFDGQAWHGADAAVGSTCVSAMEVDSAGNVWLGAYEIIWRYERASQTWTDYPLPETLLTDFNFAYPRQLIIDQAGDVWVIMEMCGGASCGVSSNLYRIHDGEWSLIIEAADWSSPLRQLVLDGNGQAWLFWEDMVFRLDEKPIESLAQVTTRGVGVSPDGKIWVVAGIGEETNLQVFVP